ncbi:hypothetical protein M1403_02955 [Patescibacteria group bacterium]|nr:hypothetical protein [Patescibacteria group bacterium]
MITETQGLSRVAPPSLHPIQQDSCTDILGQITITRPGFNLTALLFEIDQNKETTLVVAKTNQGPLNNYQVVRCPQPFVKNEIIHISFDPYPGQPNTRCSVCLLPRDWKENPKPLPLHFGRGNNFELTYRDPESLEAEKGREKLYQYQEAFLLMAYCVPSPQILDAIRLPTT